MSSIDSSSRTPVVARPCHSVFTSSATLSSAIGVGSLFAAVTGKRWRIVSVYVHHVNSTDVQLLFGAGITYRCRYGAGSGTVGLSTRFSDEVDWPSSLSTAVNAVVGSGSYDVGGFTYVEVTAELLPMAFETQTGD